MPFLDLSSVRSVGLQPTGRLVTVDINGRFGSTHGTTRSISTVGSVTPTENYGRYRRSVRFIVPRNWSISTMSVGSYKKKSVDGRYRPSKWTNTQKNSKKVLMSSLRTHTSQCQQMKTTVCQQLQAHFTKQHAHPQRPRWTRTRVCKNSVHSDQTLSLKKSNFTSTPSSRIARPTPP